MEAEDFEVTKILLGVLSQDTNNHLFKILVDHMLNQSEKDSQEKRELK